MSSSGSSSVSHSSTSSRSRSPQPQQQHQQHQQPPPDLQSAASYFSYPVSRVVSGLYRRLTDVPSSTHLSDQATDLSSPPPLVVFTPKRTASPLQPPPLTALTLKSTTCFSPQLLTRTLAEEIRLLVPPRLQLVDTWTLAYSLERDGSSLATLYENCRQFSNRSQRAGYALVVRDSSGGALFGAYLTDPPHPSPHFYGTGECFLWRASILSPSPLIYSDGESLQLMTGEQLEKAGLPPPPSADTTHAVRSTTLRGENETQRSSDLLAPPGEINGSSLLAQDGPEVGSRSGASTPERIRFKAFPYSGINDYMIFCETGFLSVGGGDGHYGLWIDNSVEKGVSSPCETFGNEPLSDEGAKFDILGVEVWYIGA
ncbi:hypothetical protein V8E54_010492 [Elaphomyces granulatus]